MAKVQIREILAFRQDGEQGKQVVCPNCRNVEVPVAFEEVLTAERLAKLAPGAMMFCDACGLELGGQV